jgi:hypothetical protein
MRATIASLTCSSSPEGRPVRARDLDGLAIPLVYLTPLRDRSHLFMRPSTHVPRTHQQETFRSFQRSP